MTTRPANARDAALQALRDRGGNVTAHLDRVLAGSDLGGADQALARELALGTVRRRGTLHAVLHAFLSRPGQQLPSPVGEVLLLGLYQVLFMDRVPDFAAVDEAVEQARRRGRDRQAGLVNGLLRSLLRGLSPVVDGRPPRDPHVLPVGPDRFRRFDRPVFADPQADPARYLAEAYSLPPRLAGRWLARCGSIDRAAALAAHANARAPVILRVNRLRSAVADVCRALAEEGEPAEPHVNGASVVLAGRGHVAQLGVFKRGLVQVQDPSATEVGFAAAARAGMCVCDLCAAPGTKTTHLAELMDDSGSITAVDVTDEKLARIAANCRRLGLTIVSACLAERVGSLPGRSFDVVLVDAPCSNTGVLARRPEARWRFDERKLRSLVRDQHTLIAAGAALARPGGRLVYSTCSLEPEECSRTARRAVDRVDGLHLRREHVTWPDGADAPANWRDGGYYAVFDVR